MGILGNILWFIFGGFAAGLSWVIAGIGWCITIIGIPIGLQCFKFAGLAFFPFGKEVTYGGGAMALGKGAYAIHQSGKWYTDANIDQMLMERHLNKKARRSSGKNHLKGPRKRTEEDDIRFAESFEKLVLKGKTWNLQ